MANTPAPVQPLVQSMRQSELIQPIAAAASTSAIDEVFFDFGSSDELSDIQSDDDLMHRLNCWGSHRHDHHYPSAGMHLHLAG